MKAGSVLATLAVAALSAFLGGVIGSRSQVEAADPQTIRASRFELVNASGATVATWEVGSGNEAHLRFLPVRGGAAVDIGVLPDGRPIVQMAGRDGKKRIVLELDQLDKPMLGMGDERWEGRVHLGFTEPDMPSPDWDNWGLSFRGSSERPVAAIGMVKSGTGSDGLLTISGKEIR